MERFCLKKFDDVGDFLIADDCCGQGLYAKSRYTKGAIVTYFGEPVDQPLLEDQNLLVGRCFEHAEYYRKDEEYRKKREDYILEFDKQLCKTKNPETIEYVGVYDVAKVAPQVAIEYISQRDLTYNFKQEVVETTTTYGRICFGPQDVVMEPDTGVVLPTDFTEAKAKVAYYILQLCRYNNSPLPSWWNPQCITGSTIDECWMNALTALAASSYIIFDACKCRTTGAITPWEFIVSQSRPILLYNCGVVGLALYENVGSCVIYCPYKPEIRPDDADWTSLVKGGDVKVVYLDYNSNMDDQYIWLIMMAKNMNRTHELQQIVTEAKEKCHFVKMDLDNLALVYFAAKAFCENESLEEIKKNHEEVAKKLHDYTQSGHERKKEYWPSFFWLKNVEKNTLVPEQDVFFQNNNNNSRKDKRLVKLGQCKGFYNGQWLLAMQNFDNNMLPRYFEKVHQLRQRVDNLWVRGVVDPLFIGSEDGTPDEHDGYTPKQFCDYFKKKHPIVSCLINEPLRGTHANVICTSKVKKCTTKCVETIFNRDVRCFPELKATAEIYYNEAITWHYCDAKPNGYERGYIPVPDNYETYTLNGYLVKEAIYFDINQQVRLSTLDDCGEHNCASNGRCSRCQGNMIFYNKINPEYLPKSRQFPNAVYSRKMSDKALEAYLKNEIICRLIFKSTDGVVHRQEVKGLIDFLKYMQYNNNSNVKICGRSIRNNLYAIDVKATKNILRGDFFFFCCDEEDDATAVLNYMRDVYKKSG